MGAAAEIRQEMSSVVDRLDPRWLKAASKNVRVALSALLDTALVGRGHLLGWVPAFPGDVDVLPLVTERLGRSAVYLPRTTADGPPLFVSVSAERGRPGPGGTYGPSSWPGSVGAVFDESDARRSVLLLPGLAFDRSGARLGRAPSFYDEFVNRPGVREMAKVGVCWSMQVVPSLPPSVVRARVDWLCDETGCRPVVSEGRGASL